MENRGLLFIPDISGFTRFVNEIEITHSRAIIQELLEILLNANTLKLEVSEIEGDAILFYRYGEPPALRDIYAQVEQMFIAFHRHLAAYEIRKYCHCQACVSAIGLTLKVITHAGEFASYTVKNFTKLIGKDVIVAHQLLKNDIATHEYWLVTNQLLQDQAPGDFRQWMQWNASKRQTESGEVPFVYTQIGSLRSEIGPSLPPDLGIPNKVKVISMTRTYNENMIKMFHAVGDFRYRGQWREGVRKIEEVDHLLPRLGMHCRYTLDSGEQVIYSSHFRFTPERVELEETDEAKLTAHRYILEKVDEQKTQVTIEYYIRKNLLQQMMFNLSQKKEVEAKIDRSMDRLTGFAHALTVPLVDPFTESPTT